MPALDNPAYERAAVLMAEGWKQIDVARELGVDKVTITRWKQRPEVFVRIRELVTDITSQSVALLRDQVMNNTQIILDIAQNGGEPGIVSSRLKAALWCVQTVMDKPDPGAGTDRRKKGLEAKLARYKDDELQELAERGE